MGIVDRLRRVLGHPADTPSTVASEELEWPEGLSQHILMVEEASLAVYRQHGLPTAKGSYYRRGPDAPWEALPAGLTPSEKWALLEHAPEGAGWKFVERASLGRHSDKEEVQRASALLRTCDNLRRKIEQQTSVTAQDIADAMLLGSASTLLMQSLNNTSALQPKEEHTPLVFVAVEDDQD